MYYIKQSSGGFFWSYGMSAKSAKSVYLRLSVWLSKCYYILTEIVNKESMLTHVIILLKLTSVISFISFVPFFYNLQIQTITNCVLFAFLKIPLHSSIIYLLTCLQEEGHNTGEMMVILNLSLVIFLISIMTFFYNLMVYFLHIYW